MLNTIVIDKNDNSKELISSYLKNIEGIGSVLTFDNFESLSCPLDEINLIVFDVTFDSSNCVIQKLKEIKNKYPNVEFIAVSYEINSELVSKILKEDVKEFLLKPIIPNILESAVKKINQSNTKLELIKANTISIYSNKGGVGKTSLAVNLAYELANYSNEKVCLLDLSFNPEDMGTFLNLEFKATLNNVLSNIKNLNEKQIPSLAVNYANSNLYVFSFQDDFNFNSKIDLSNLSFLINSLKNSFKYIIIDAPSNMDETAVSILDNSDLILLIGLINLASIRNCQKCYELFENLEYNKNKIKLIINRYIENSEISLKDTEETIGEKVFYKIPNNYLTLIDAINLGKTVIETNPRSNIAKAYKNLAKEITDLDFLSLGELNKKTNYTRGVFNLLRRMGE